MNLFADRALFWTDAVVPWILATAAPIGAIYSFGLVESRLFGYGRFEIAPLLFLICVDAAILIAGGAGYALLRSRSPRLIGRLWAVCVAAFAWSMAWIFGLAIADLVENNWDGFFGHMGFGRTIFALVYGSTVGAAFVMLTRGRSAAGSSGLRRVGLLGLMCATPAILMDAWTVIGIVRAYGAVVAWNIVIVDLASYVALGVVCVAATLGLRARLAVPAEGR